MNAGSRIHEMQVYSASKGRRFAITMAIAFAAITGLLFWKENKSAALVLASIAAVFGVAGVAIPRYLEPVERVWMAFARVLSRVTTPVFMGVVYLVVLTPTGILRRTFGSSPLVRPLDRGSYWVKRKTPDADASRSRMERQF